MSDAPTRTNRLATRWIVLLVVAAVFALLCLRLGTWQLARWDEAKAEAATLSARLDTDPVPLATPFADPTSTSADDLRYLVVEARGTFASDEQVLQRSRALRGLPGEHVLTPLRLATPLPGGEDVILVSRGWIPNGAVEGPDDPAIAPPSGTVTVVGYLRPSQPQPGFGATDPAEGHLDRVFNVDLDRLASQVTGSLAPVFLEATVPTAADIEVSERPEVDTTQHISYAVQWFSFGTIGLVGAVLAVRRGTRRPDVA